MINLEKWLSTIFKKMYSDASEVEFKAAAAEFIGISVPTLYKWIREGKHYVCTENDRPVFYRRECESKY